MRDFEGRVTHHEIVVGVTSLTKYQAPPARLLRLVRGHWGIENRLHWVRDMAFDEDRCRARKGSEAHALASLRNLAIGVLRIAGAVNIAAALRHCAHQAEAALRLMGV